MKKIFIFIFCVFLLLNQMACNTYSKKIAAGMAAGALVGAAIGNRFEANKDNKDRERNTIISSIVFSLLTGGALSWHYQQVEQAKVEISGRYARYRLCDPEEMKTTLAKQLKFDKEDEGEIYYIQKNQIGNLAIYLDDNTKWAYPVFRKRYLQPDRSEKQVISSRYIWEIIKSGHFVTRSQNPQYFVEED